NGEFTIAETPTKRADWKQRGLQLIACKSGVGLGATYLEASSEWNSQPLKLKLMSATPLRMQVRDPQGKPLANTDVQLTRIERPSILLTESLPAPHFRGRTNNAGEVTFDTVPAKSRPGFQIRTEAYGTQLQSVTPESPVFQLRAVG